MVCVVKFNRTISVDMEAWEFMAKTIGYGEMSGFINAFLESEAKRRGMMGGYVNTFSPSIKEPEAPPETPEQTWRRIEGEVNYVRACIEEVKPDNPDYSIEDFPFLFEYANKCKMSRNEFKRWVNGDYKEVEMKANVAADK